eukprot:10002214-Alexandrium_andersonii.AAC.1
MAGGHSRARPALGADRMAKWIWGASEWTHLAERAQRAWPSVLSDKSALRAWASCRIHLGSPEAHLAPR